MLIAIVHSNKSAVTVHFYPYVYNLWQSFPYLFKLNIHYILTSLLCVSLIWMAQKEDDSGFWI